MDAKSLEEPSRQVLDRAVPMEIFPAVALETLYRSNAGRLMRRFARQVGREEACDVVQEAFAKLAGIKPQDYAGIDNPDAYVTTMAANALRDRARSAARHALQQSQLVQDPGATAPDPHRAFQGREALRAIERALEDMNPRRRRIFMLHRFEQMTYAEVGRVVGMSEKGVKKQIAKALVELRGAVERPA